MGYYRSQERNRRLKKLYNEKHGCIFPIFYDDRKQRLVKYNKTKYWKWLKRKANKRVRKSQLTLNNSKYKKQYNVFFSYW